MKKRNLLVISLLLLVCFLAGCGSGSSTNGTSGISSRTSTSSVWTDVQVVALKLKIEDFKNADKLYENYFGEYNLPIGFKDLIKNELQMVANGFALTESQGGNINQKMLFAHQTVKNFFATKMMKGEMNDFIKFAEESVKFEEQEKSGRLYREIYKKEIEVQEPIATTTMSQEEKKEVEIREEQVKKTEEKGPGGFEKHVKEQEQLVVNHNLPYKLEKSANKVLHLENLVEMKDKGGSSAPAPNKKEHKGIEGWNWWDADIILTHGVNEGGKFPPDIYGYWRHAGIYDSGSYGGKKAFIDSMPGQGVAYSLWSRWQYDYQEVGAFYAPILSYWDRRYVMDYARLLIGKPWGYLHDKTNVRNSVYCSQLVWWAYKEGVVRWDNQPASVGWIKYWWGRAMDIDSDGGIWVLPDDISDSYHLLRKWKNSIAQ